MDELIERMRKKLGSARPQYMVSVLPADLEDLLGEINRLQLAVAQAETNSWSNVGQRERAEAAEAKLREAVKWVREARKWCQEGLSGQHDRLAEQALERIHEATGDFLATMEKPSDP